MIFNTYLDFISFLIIIFNALSLRSVSLDSKVYFELLID